MVTVNGLLAFSEVQRRLGLTNQAYLGRREIPIERIVGSLDTAR